MPLEVTSNPSLSRKYRTFTAFHFNLYPTPDRYTGTFRSSCISMNHKLFFFCTLDAELLARSQCLEGPVTGHFHTGFSLFPCA